MTSDRIRALRRREPGLSPRDIARRLGCRVDLVRQVGYADERRENARLGALARQAGFTEPQLRRAAELHGAHREDRDRRGSVAPFVSLGDAAARVVGRLGGRGNGH